MTYEVRARLPMGYTTEAFERSLSVAKWRAQTFADNGGRNIRIFKRVLVPVKFVPRKPVKP
jgi:hypothetical protein